MAESLQGSLVAHYDSPTSFKTVTFIETLSKSFFCPVHFYFPLFLSFHGSLFLRVL